MKAQDCSTCRFWLKASPDGQEDVTLGEGWCRRHAPSPRSFDVWLWPKTLGECWCGDFQFKQSGDPPPTLDMGVQMVQ